MLAGCSTMASFPISYTQEVRGMSSFSNSSFKDSLRGLTIYESKYLKEGEKVSVQKIETLVAESMNHVAIERWTISRGGESVFYIIRIAHDGQGAPLFNISVDDGLDPRGKPMLPALKK